jgi:hypothetical protein
MRDLIFTLWLLCLCILLVCDNVNAAGRRQAVQSPCAIGACAMVQQKSISDWWTKPTMPVVAPPVAPLALSETITIDVPITAGIEAATVHRPVVTIVKGAALGASKLIKGAAKVATAPVRFIANKKPARKLVGAIVPGRRCRE